jgi:hypothetical protein
MNVSAGPFEEEVLRVLFSLMHNQINYNCLNESSLTTY